MAKRMTPLEKLKQIEEETKGINREYPILSSENTDWLIKRVKQLEKALDDAAVDFCVLEEYEKAELCEKVLENE